MSHLRVFISHSSAENEFCDLLAKALQDAAADVWYGQHPRDAGQLSGAILQELQTRPVFVVVLSPRACASAAVRAECDWACNLAQREPQRTILLVVARPLTVSDLAALPSLAGLQRVGSPSNAPQRASEIIAWTLELLGFPAHPASDVDGLIGQGETLMWEQRYQEAVAIFKRVVKQQPDTYVAWNALGKAAFHLQRWADARNAFERTTALRPASGKSWSDLSATLTYLNRHQEALRASDRAIALQPELVGTWDTRGGIFARMGNYGEALRALDYALTLDPDNAAVWTNKGDVLTYVGQRQEALAAYDRAIAIDPSSDRAWGEKSLLLVGLGEMYSALASADRALALQPNAARYWMVRATALAALQNAPAALEACDRCLALDPHLPEINAIKALRSTLMSFLQASAGF